MSRVPRDSHFHGSDLRDNPRFSESYPIFQFYSESDGPWLPAGVIQPAAALTSLSRPSAYSGARGFDGYRSPGLPSECGTAPEDSGYGGTRSTYSIVESVTSIAENDRCTGAGYLETQSTEQLINDLNINATVPIYQPPQMPHAQEFHCDECGASVKTKSELKKHSHRHLKPYKCTYEACPKAKQGFSTPNDLTRHRRTVHREHNDNDPLYICRQGNCARKKEKLWPRADNFRSHLARSHNINLKADSDLGEYRYKPDTAKLHELRDDRRSVTNVNPGRRPHQPQDAPLVYTCRHDPCPQAKEKTWPRIDEFRAHLSRVHNIQPDDDLNDYHYQLEAAEAHALRGVGSLVADVDPGSRPAQLQDSPDLRSDQASSTASGQVQTESSKQSSLPLTLSRLPSGDKPHLVRSNILDDLKLPSAPSSESLVSNAIVDLTSPDEVSLEEPGSILPSDEAMLESFDHDGDNVTGSEEEVLHREEPLTLQIVSPSTSVPSRADTQDDIPEALHTADEPSDIPGPPAKAPTDALTFDSRKPSELFPFLKNATLSMPSEDGAIDIVSFLRNIPKDLLEKALKPEDQAETCTECGKAFSRRCELRKHMKRHIKPYGCTYKACKKMFGSKNDWKRHESSQHFQLESWNCNISDCDKVLPRRELFKTHLIDHHKVRDVQMIESLQESRRLGRHCDPRFWCGFCDKFVEIEGEVVNSWTKRCDHIDSHLFGKDDLEKKTMDKWHYLEDKLAEGEPEISPSGFSKKRKATEDVSSRPTKRTNISWKCCRCNHVESYCTSSSCQESDCQHQRCKNCDIEATLVLDEDTEMASLGVE
ncbi:hypothetical protein V8C42DRAFT_360250 [Trichoderma barbatum]